MGHPCKITTLHITPQERVALQETVSDHGGPQRRITDSEFIEHLRVQQEEYEKVDKFVGITRFIRGHLLGKGFDPAYCYQVLELLEEQGKIEIYKVDNPYSEFKTSAIRILIATA